MARVRKIERAPRVSEKNYFLVDACFLVNKYLTIARAPNVAEQDAIRQCKRWWDAIDIQLDSGRARIYIPDICIAESFKVLARKYYNEKAFPNSERYQNARKRLSQDISCNDKLLKAQKRYIRCHDLPTTRDLIVSLDRFYELFMKHNPGVSVPDLIIVTAAKYLIDFYDIPKSRLHIVTLDNALWKGSKRISELPNAYDPTQPSDAFDRVFQ